MKRLAMLSLLAMSIVAWSARGDVVESTPLIDDRSEWKSVTPWVEGFRTVILFPPDMTTKQSMDVLVSVDLLRKQLKRVSVATPPEAYMKLAKSQSITIDDDCTFSNGGRAIYFSTINRVVFNCFAFTRNMLEDTHKGGEEVVVRNKVWGNPRIVLHELAHGWHAHYVEDGYRNEKIHQFYEHALDCYGGHGY